MRLAQLTEREKECLRLLLHPMRAKEIARVTGLSVHTVNDHLKSARRKLNASDSLSAAHMLRKYEDDPPQSLGIKKSGWSDPGDARHDAETEVRKRGSTVLPVAMRGRPWNDLSLHWRIVWPLLLMGIIALGAGALVAGASALSQLALSLSN